MVGQHTAIGDWSTEINFEYTIGYRTILHQRSREPEMRIRLWGDLLSIFQSSSDRSNEQLDAVLTATANWMIYGVGKSPGLRRQLTACHGSRVGNMLRPSAVVLAVAQLPSDAGVVCPAQMDRPRKVIARREVPPIRHADIFARITDHRRDAQFSEGNRANKPKPATAT